MNEPLGLAAVRDKLDFDGMVACFALTVGQGERLMGIFETVYNIGRLDGGIEAARKQTEKLQTTEATP